MNFPDDADGDVLRSLESEGFDFDKPVWIDFNIDFEEWPPPLHAITLFQERYPEAVIQPREEEGIGYVLFQIQARLAYELVIRMQAQLTEGMRPFQGNCASWGVLH